ncbi:MULTISPECIES: hypothetical protein [unclassified Candidatus Frackibacter]|uniref:hypothetical protein n=1 Tax=unclassified Candidatus Frackibacter TaxID=2648818 RepID=UPI0008811989|nr:MULTISPECIES: hypothetical protein [unclassified Candidatus Frackibacter]SDC11249.1 Predicted nucleotide-binding protein, sugar kinase/HSP70/actin superfamily [Candidatus Frackibacter sp. WG11]SEM36601.1 Predicted nucleotide-binding protein, sugar kinase/HSP70/actin superfamily [Candidatus Frackibacter sp. WG12]SFL41919.1 Predicted nucleotide-binding protein, sugar kinase/HSP70/actin superfamily [Candidatus Frackibacter sp. WG13]
MKVTFPQMGSLNIPLETLLQGLNIEIVSPPPLTKRTLNLGVKYSPESACLPFKLVLGNFIEALELGAEAIIMAGGNGPCRFGHFGELANDILTDLGYEFELYILEPPVKSIVDIFVKLSPNFNWVQVIKSLRFAWKKLILIEEIKKYRLKHGVFLSKNQINKLEDEYLQLIREAKNKEELASIDHNYKKEIDEFTDGQQTSLLKVGLVGDIYTVSEPFANLNVSKRLNELGVAIDRAVFVSKWVKDNLICGALNISSNRKVIKAAKRYLQEGVGGLGLETVGETVLYGEQGYDGVIQLAPFGCMPEIVAKSLLTEVERDFGLPVLTLTLDEHASATGVQTRLEAFVDLLTQKKNLNKKTFLN